MRLQLIIIGLLLIQMACASKSEPILDKQHDQEKILKVGAERLDTYLAALKEKKIALVVNQTSRVGEVHLVDTLQRLGVDIQHIFAPEHGFRGAADAGAVIEDGVDLRSGLKIISLYGKNKKPSGAQLDGIDMVVFDIQDVGTRFYTYLSTMHYVMEACAENDIPVLILDRPNPNGFYVDGPVLDPAFQSFVGMHAIPVVHGMTLGELAQMINGEGWLKDGVQCDLTVIPVTAWQRQDVYELPIPPSPNLRSTAAILNYPSLCFFEGTSVSIGRGTEDPFTVVGHPDLVGYDFSFKPVSGPGAKYPKHENQTCFGVNQKDIQQDYVISSGIRLDDLITFYKKLGSNSYFLENNFIDKLAGNDELRKAIMEGKTADEIKASWSDGINNFLQKRRIYLLYPE